MRMRKDAKVELIRSAPVFSHCSKRELQALARQGDRGREFIVIVDGAADVQKNGRRINRLGSGEFLGEIALISGAPRTATVTTTAESHLLVLDDRAFRRVIERIPSVQVSVMRALSDRLTADAL